MESTELPWLKHLPDEDKEPFFRELAKELVASISEGDVRGVDAVLAAWRGTAEVLADPEVKEVLLTATEGDFGEVPRPFERHWFVHGYQTYDTAAKVYFNICGTCDQLMGQGNHFAPGSKVSDDLSPDTLRAFITRMSAMLGEMTKIQETNRELLKVIAAKNQSLETVDKFLERRNKTIEEQRDQLRELEEQLNQVRKKAKQARTDCYSEVLLSEIQPILKSLEQSNQHGGAL